MLNFLRGVINKQKRVIEPGLNPVNMVWLASADLAQTPHEDIIDQLLGRYPIISRLLYLFRDFDFTPRQPVKLLTL